MHVPKQCTDPFSFEIMLARFAACHTHVLPMLQRVSCSPVATLAHPVSQLCHVRRETRYACSLPLPHLRSRR